MLVPKAREWAATTRRAAGKGTNSEEWEETLRAEAQEALSMVNAKLVVGWRAGAVTASFYTCFVVHFVRRPVSLRQPPTVTAQQSIPSKARYLLTYDSSISELHSEFSGSTTCLYHSTSHSTALAF